MINLGLANQMLSCRTDSGLSYVWQKARGRALILLEWILVFKLWLQFFKSDGSIQYVVRIYVSWVEKKNKFNETALLKIANNLEESVSVPFHQIC